nr:putative ribonuclease H-like domain-containing protein [Tanacetum cinerariifolium]
MGSLLLRPQQGNPQQALKYKGMFDSGCSRHMTGNKALLTDYQDINGGFVAFGGRTKGGKITVTDDFSRFSCVFFLATKSETSGIPKKFITEIENQLNNKVKVIMSDNGIEFKNKEMDEFYGKKGIKRKYSVARTPQQNGAAKRKNRTLIEAARTILADSLLPTIFWAEAVNTACYVLNRVLVTKPHNKTPYELIIGRPPSISFMRSFRCPVTLLNTFDPLGKFDRKVKKGVLVGYSINSKAFSVFNTQTRKVKENLHVNFLENKLNVAGQGPNWLFDIDSLANSMNYQPITASIKLTKMQVTKKLKSSDDRAEDNTTDDAAGKVKVQELVSEYGQALKNFLVRIMNKEKEATEQSDDVRKEFQAQFNTASISRAFIPPHDPLMPKLEDTDEIQTTGIFGYAYDENDLETNNHSYTDESVGAKADFNNMEPSTIVSPIPITRVHSNHPKDQIIRDPMLAVQTRVTLKKSSGEHAMICYIQKKKRTNHKDFQNYLFACFLSQHEPTKITQALNDKS